MEIHAYIDQFLIEQSYNGSFLFAYEGTIRLCKGYGWADMEQKRLNDEHTVFKIASIGKQFTATAIMLLQQRGQLGVQDKVAQYVPELPGLKHLTIHQLLTHAAGLDEDILVDWNVDEDMAPLRLQEMETVVPAHQVGSFHYSNFGYALLGLIVERVSGRTYEEFIQQELFLSLHMERTGGHLASYLAEGNRAIGYAEGKPAWKQDIPSYNSAGSILYSTVRDLYRWERACYAAQLIGSDALREMFTPHVAIDDERGYGYGWMIYSGRRNTVYHNGSLAGFRSTLYRNTEKDAVLIALSNLGDTGLEPIERLKRSIASWL
ncbi:serine hydrolase domain-containing protein [Paenibacillus apiarius]|uniref:serine hydrolase domain-containing protein n=2 Tax=Paenibacillus apiarius TaxID=46240 RepID=UPI0019814DEA|nr:serine hydrolase domain-containing protein [Paenibacillus apiarius]MBN3526335.1 beta-lactamase family protein [Paenibacillus apiarius]